MSTSHGRFVWYELMTTDAAAATEFYSSVLGWTARDAGMSDKPYTILSAGETMVGGLLDLPQSARDAGARPGWIGYIAVEDVDAYAARVQHAGGTIHRAPEDIPGVGRFAVAGDPQKAAFVLFSPSGTGQAPPDTGRAPGHVGWHELQAADWQTAFAFYADLFGWTKDEAIDMGPKSEHYRNCSRVAGTQAGGADDETDAQSRPFWLYYSMLPKSTRRLHGEGRRRDRLSTGRSRFPAECGSRRAWIRRACCLPWLPQPAGELRVQRRTKRIKVFWLFFSKKNRLLF